MAATKTLYVELKAGVGAYVAGMKIAADATANVGRTALAAGAGIERLAGASTRSRNALAGVALAAGGALVGGLGYGVAKAVELERSLYNVATISDEVRTHMGATTQALIEMSTRLPQSANELALGLYDIVSSGFQAKDAMLVLDAAATGASAGLSTTATSGRAITAILNAYGLSASHAADVNDVLFQTVNKGVLTYDQLANSVALYVGSAAASKVPIEDAAAAQAAMTLTGLDAAEAGISLNQVFQHIVKPSEDMAQALHKIGFESGSAALASLGLHGTITKLAGSMGTSYDTALKLFPEIRAARGYLALTSAEGRNYASTFDAIAVQVNRAGAAQKALQVQSHSAAYQLGIVKNQATGLAIQLGEALLPAVHLIIGGLSDFLGLLHTLPGPVQTVLGVVALLGGAALLAGGAFLKAKPMLDGFKLSLATMRAEGSALPGVLKGIGLAAGLVGVALIAASVVYGIYADRKRKAKEATDSFVAAIEAERQGAKGSIDTSLIQTIVKDGDIDLLKKAGVGVAEFVNAAKSGGPQLGRIFSDINKQGKLSTGEFLRLGTSAAHMSGNFAAATKISRDTANATAAVGKAAAGTRKPLQDLASMTARDKNGVEQFTEAQKALQSQLAGMGDAAGAWSRAMDDVKPAALAALAKDSKRQTDAVKAGLKSLAPAARTSLAAFTLELQKGLADQQAYMSNLAALTRRGRADLVQEFIKMGADGPKAAAAVVKGTDAELGKLAGVMRSRSALAGAALSNGLDILAVIAAAGGAATVASLAAAFTGGHLDSMRLKLAEIRNSVNDIPTQHTIDILLGKVPGPINIAIGVTYTAGALAAKLGRLAEGGILRAYAGGGIEQHVAQVAPAGTMRVWAEPETGGEAYIPLATSKRARSAAVLSVVARQFGQQLIPMADGGVIGGGARGGRTGPLIGQLIVQPQTLNATPAEMMQEAFFRARQVVKSGGRW